jgi:alkanesulfonate monooxygenase SsuD/methylene tetrahydromethanopterin reductase-like flavin-dependent oxidoreductase (luciferase family)
MWTQDLYSHNGKHFSVPERCILPKPIQKPHPPMWIACTNRGTIEVAARNGIGALAFSFVDPAEAEHWVNIYYDLIDSDECIPLGHTVNPNVALVTSFSIHENRAEAIRRGHDGFHFFRYALGALVASDTVPGRTALWDEYVAIRGDAVERSVESAEAAGDDYSGGIGTPDDVRKHLRELEAAGVDQVILLQQGGKNKHEHICESLELFADEVMPEFAERDVEKEAEKAQRLAPAVERALARKQWMEPLDDEDIPVVKASVSAPQVAGTP